MTAVAPIPSTLQSQLGWRHHLAPETLSTGIATLDGIVGGCPRGRITEVVGRVSTGRTAIRNQLLAEATARGEFCAVVDAMDAFDPATAQDSGVALDRLVWVQCGGNLENAMRAVDLLLHSGGFGVVVLDLCDAPEAHLRRVPLSYWFRFRRCVETGQTVCLVVAERPLAHSCSSLLVEMERAEVGFHNGLLRNLKCKALPRKPICPRPAEYIAQAG